jgi:hypothetical protein
MKKFFVFILYHCLFQITQSASSVEEVVAFKAGDTAAYNQRKAVVGRKTLSFRH